MNALDPVHFCQGWLKRIEYWKTITDERLLRNFDLVQAIDGYEHNAAHLVEIVRLYSLAASAQKSRDRFQRTGQQGQDSVWLENLQAYHPRMGLDAGRPAVIDWNVEKRELTHYIARVDHDFFFGLLTRPVRVADTLLITNPVFDLEFIDGPAPLDLDYRNGLDMPILASFDRRDKKFRIYAKNYRLPAGWRDARFTAEELDRLDLSDVPIDSRSPDEMLIAAVNVMCNIFLKLGSYYPRTGRDRVRQLLGDGDNGKDPLGYGEEWAKLVNFVFKWLAQCKMGNETLELEAEKWEYGVEGCEMMWKEYTKSIAGEGQDPRQLSDEQIEADFEARYPEVRGLQQVQTPADAVQSYFDYVLILGLVSFLWVEWPIGQLLPGDSVALPFFSLFSFLARLCFLLGTSASAIVGILRHYGTLNGSYHISCYLAAAIFAVPIIRLIGLDPVSFDHLNAIQALIGSGFELFWNHRMVEDEPRVREARVPRIDLAGDCVYRL